MASEINELSVRRLTVTRGRKTVFKNLDLNCRFGTITQIRGENGCGKSTLLRVIAGILPLSSGKVQFLSPKTVTGSDSSDALETTSNSKASSISKTQLPPMRLRYLGHTNGLESHLSVEENLLWPTTFPNEQRGQEEVEQMLLWGGIDSWRHLQIRHLSEGQKRRVALTCTLYPDADLYLLDEPFTNLDERASEFWQNKCLEVTSNKPEKVAGENRKKHSGAILIAASHRSFDAIAAKENKPLIQVKQFDFPKLNTA